MYFRVGGPHVGKADTALVVNSDHALIDHTWVWRGDHGVEGFTDTQRWNTNTGRIGVVVNGDDVTATGLFVEHFQTYNTVWNGEHGTTCSTRTSCRTTRRRKPTGRNRTARSGIPATRSADGVAKHSLYGGGVYVFNQNNPSILTENGFEVPEGEASRCTTS